MCFEDESKCCYLARTDACDKLKGEKHESSDVLPI